VKEVEAKLVPLTRLHELSQSTEERLTTLNALAEHVSRKAKALEGQQQAVEHAVVQANRVNEMVWAMDVQINKLNDGIKQAAKTEEAIARIEKLSEETVTRMDAAARLNQEFHRDASRLERESSAMLESVRAEVVGLTARKKEFETFDERVRALQGAVAEAESRMTGVAAKDKNVAALTEKVDSLTTRFESLFAQADDLTK
jgi:predicted  nucleic acid-binding Zn-ribbon protein